MKAEDVIYTLKSNKWEQNKTRKTYLWHTPHTIILRRMYVRNRRILLRTSFIAIMNSVLQKYNTRVGTKKKLNNVASIFGPVRPTFGTLTKIFLLFSYTYCLLSVSFANQVTTYYLRTYVPIKLFFNHFKANKYFD